MLRILVAGLTDALSPRRLTMIWHDKVIMSKLRKTWLLNMCLFLGSLLFFEQGLMRGLSYILEAESLTSNAFRYAYYFTFLYPVYFITLLLNGRWYSRVAEQALAKRAGDIARANLTSHQRGRATQLLHSRQSGLAQLTGELYRLIFGFVYLAQSALVSRLPFVGGLALFAWLAFMYSLYAFEYVWSLLGMTQQQRLAYFSTHWLYMLGYGAPLALNMMFSPPLVRDGLFAITFPLFIINSIWAKPVKLPENSRLRQRINPFWLSQLCSTPLIKRGIGDLYRAAVRLLLCCGSALRWLRGK